MEFAIELMSYLDEISLEIPEGIYLDMCKKCKALKNEVGQLYLYDMVYMNKKIKKTPDEEFDFKIISTIKTIKVFLNEDHGLSRGNDININNGDPYSGLVCVEKEPGTYINFKENYINYNTDVLISIEKNKDFKPIDYNDEILSTILYLKNNLKSKYPVYFKKIMDILRKKINYFEGRKLYEINYMYTDIEEDDINNYIIKYFEYLKDDSHDFVEGDSIDFDREDGFIKMFKKHNEKVIKNDDDDVVISFDENILISIVEV